MKTRMYWRYATRSLSRGGQRTVLAIFCVAVGVLAVVSLQLVGNMVNHALTDNLRAANGGDLYVWSAAGELPASDLAAFARLKSEGILTNYSAVSDINAGMSERLGAEHSLQIWAVDPANFPLAGTPHFADPENGRLSTLLHDRQVVVTQSLLTTLGAHVGDALTVHSLGRSFTVHVAGEIENTAFFSSATMLMAFSSFVALPTTNPAPLGLQAIYADVPGHSDGNAALAKQQLQEALPLASVTTTHDTLQQSKNSVQNIRYFMQVAGLLALLIGGIGIINTMQVVLRRRHIEIAMLKTAGYQGHDLVNLFGLEAGILGFIGGIVGAAAGIGVSFLVKGLMENALTLTLPETIDPVTVLSGVAVGFCTALIFGLLPIVQASRIRPVAVLREFDKEKRRGNVLVTAVMGVIVVALFCLMALGILQNVALAVGVVIVATIVLLLLTLCFTLMAVLIGKLAVPDHVSWIYAMVEVPALLLTAFLLVQRPAAGVLLLVAVLLSVLAVCLPQSTKANVTLALRNIGRNRVRSATTLVALFVGVFAIGLIVTLGQSLEQGISSTAANYTGGDNTFIQAGSADKPAVDQELAKIPGIQAEAVTSFAPVQPEAIGNVPVGTFLLRLSSIQRQTAIADLSGVVGYNLAQGQHPFLTLVSGRTLGLQDAGTDHVVVSQDFARAPFNLGLGDTILLAGENGRSASALVIVGIFQPATTFDALSHPIVGDVSLTNSLTSGHPIYLYSLVLAPRDASGDLAAIQQSVPSASVISLAQELNFYLNLLNNLVIMLTAVASLSLLAGLIIIANAVALAMLERRRELGIFKSVGYTSGSILGEVLLENGAVGLFGALLAMLVATLASTILASLAFHVTLNVSPVPPLVVVVGTTVICMLVAGLVAWRATRVRPLEVLRYE
jgi:putative ABC transport system permease protein